ncbi:MAG: CCA tRNA nucleotidyltransferase [Bacteroidetes bacterium]|nr:CCA tRNA nucleotidyltransferase [Bacteroidota bacterium]
MNFRHKLDEFPVFRIVSEQAGRLGLKTYVVGGFVRDMMLGRELKDIDFVTLGSGIELSHAVADGLGIRRVVTYENFGTAMIPWHEQILEFVGARKEAYFDRGTRRPTVAAGTLEEDLARRDFTINAMAISLNPEDYGDLMDPFGGLSDLENRLIRTPLEPETTFDDDPLRILRGIRFATQLQYQIHPDAIASIGKVKDRLAIISQERITDEFLKILKSPKPSVGFTLMHETGVLPILYPELAVMVGVEQLDGYGHKDTFFHTLQVLDNICTTTDDVWLRLAALYHDVAKPKTKRFVPGRGWTFHGHDDLGARMVPGLFKKHRLPGTHLKFVQKLVRLHLRPIALVKDEITDSAVRRVLFEAGGDIESLMKLCRADVTTKSYARKTRYWQNYERVVAKMKEVEEKDRMREWEPPVSGADIMEICGLKPGPLVGKFKTAIEEAILEGEIPNEREPALALLGKLKSAWENGDLFR